MKVDVFVMVHRKDIILKCEANQKFQRTFKNFNYVLLGDHVRDDSLPTNVIIAKELKDNIEDLNKTLCAFTGWYAVSKNNLTTGDYALLLEYDIELHDNFIQELKSGFNDKDMVSFMKLKSDHCYYIYGFENLPTAERTELDKDGVFDWMVTTNLMIKPDALKELINWFMVKVQHGEGQNPAASHVVERSLTQFAKKFNKSFGFVLNVLTHYQLDSHNTQGMAGRFDKLIDQVTS